ncbi:MAG: hypothetical protein J3Q66DRAFT_388678, partial [Benniella sp.]
MTLLSLLWFPMTFLSLIPVPASPAGVVVTEPLFFFVGLGTLARLVVELTLVKCLNGLRVAKQTISMEMDHLGDSSLGGNEQVTVDRSSLFSRAMLSLKVYVALYDYEANIEGELSIKKNDILFILEDGGPYWWKAKLKTADPNRLHVGLVPSNYIEPLPSIGTVLGLYRYEAATEEELTIEEGNTFALYEQDDPDWLLVGNGSHVGFVPRNHVEFSIDQGGHSSEQVGDEYQCEERTPPRSNTPTVGSYREVDVKLWTVKVVDKKKKMKGSL